MSVWYSLREGLEGFRRARLAAAITVFTIGFALVLLGVSAIIAINLGRVVLQLRARIEIEAFLDPALSDEQAQKLEDEILAVRGVQTVEFVSKERAALEFREWLGEDVLAILEENPLPASFRIQLEPSFRSSAGARQVVAAVEKLDGVDEVVYRGDILRLLDRYAGAAVLIGIALGGIIALGSVLLISNTIRLVIMAKSDVIEIMRLVGATSGFIRRPFVVEGMVQGLLGGALGGAILWGIVSLANLEIPNLLVVDRRFYFGLVGLGWLFGWLGSRVAIRKYLK